MEKNFSDETCLIFGFEELVKNHSQRFMMLAIKRELPWVIKDFKNFIIDAELYGELIDMGRNCLISIVKEEIYGINRG